MTIHNLARLERVELRDIWTNEATEFTPWLARSDNLEILSDTLSLELELVATEERVGPFRADILCKDINDDHLVLVENQLEPTDHKHLGQLLTYASGLQAVTIIWIAGKFTDEHRSTLDWLNKITDDNFRFFGVEVELWRIGESPAAPRFNIVSEPNDWSEGVARAARSFGDKDLSDVKQFQLEYWTAFQPILAQTDGIFSSKTKKPQPQQWMTYPNFGRSGVRLGVVMDRKERRVRTELYISGKLANERFRFLESQKEEIEEELGASLLWEPLPDGQDCRISYHLDDADPEDRDDWERQHKWLAQQMNALHPIFDRHMNGMP